MADRIREVGSERDVLQSSREGASYINRMRAEVRKMSFPSAPDGADVAQLTRTFNALVASLEEMRDAIGGKD